MKRLFSIILGLVLALVFAGSVSAHSPAGNPAGAQKIPWNLSGAVMPVPPYGSTDIPGSDTASKLIVNQPNGKNKAAITGVMRGLNPNTEYTVYLSNGYRPYTPLSVVGTYKWLVLGTYEHDLVITTQNPDGTFSGTGKYPAGAGPYTYTEAITGQVVGNTISLTTVYTPGPYTAMAVGTIAADGTFSGSSPWEWHTTAGKATLASGSTGWPGLFTDTVPAFTFTTNEFGAGSWHLNLKAGDFPTTGAPYDLSVWINGGGATILISDNFTLGGEYHHGCGYRGWYPFRFHFGAGHYHWWCGWGF